MLWIVQNFINHHHHHHQIVQTAKSYLSLSLSLATRTYHPSVLIGLQDRIQYLHWAGIWMSAGRPTQVCPCGGVHKWMPFVRSPLLLHSPVSWGCRINRLPWSICHKTNTKETNFVSFKTYVCSVDVIKTIGWVLHVWCIGLFRQCRWESIIISIR